MHLIHPVSEAPLVLRCDLDKNIFDLLEKWQVSHHQLHKLNKL
jgi:tRNA pseudouridine65 synthase